MEVGSSKTMGFCETSFKNEALKYVVYVAFAMKNV